MRLDAASVRHQVALETMPCAVTWGSAGKTGGWSVSICLQLLSNQPASSQQTFPLSFIIYVLSRTVFKTLVSDHQLTVCSWKKTHSRFQVQQQIRRIGCIY